MKAPVDITKYLVDERKGNADLFNCVYSLVYDELRSIVRRQLLHHRRSE